MSVSMSTMGLFGGEWPRPDTQQAANIALIGLGRTILLSFIHPTIFLRFYYMPKSVLGPGDIAVNKTHKVPAFTELLF